MKVPLVYAELRICERFGWTWQELMDTDIEIVGRIFDLFEAESDAQTINEARNRPRKA